MNMNNHIIENKWWYNNIANIKKILATDRDKYIYDLNTVDLKCKNISKNNLLWGVVILIVIVAIAKQMNYF